MHRQYELQVTWPLITHCSIAYVVGAVDKDRFVFKQLQSGSLSAPSVFRQPVSADGEERFHDVTC